MLNQSKATQILLKKFEEGCQRNPSWSKRAFAQKLGLSSGALSEILTGKRALSTTTKKKVAARLQLSPQEQLDFFHDELPAHLIQERLDYVKLSGDQFHLISDWWHYGILNLLKTKGFKPFPLFIAQRLGISPKIAGEALDRLLRLGHLVKDKNLKLIRKHPRLETSDNLFDLSIKKSHTEDLKLIEKSILENSAELSDHTSMTVVVNRKDILKAKELIRAFHDSFSHQMESKGQEEVYRLSIALFPLSKIDPKDISAKKGKI